jgi:hypothetical protein
VDWYVLLTPLLLLPVASLLVFVGCGLDETGGAGPAKPSEPPSEPGPIETLQVTITYPGLSIKPWVKNFDFWCERDGVALGFHAQPTNPPNFEVDLASVSFTLGAPVLDDPRHFTCKGKVTFLPGTPWPGTNDVHAYEQGDFPPDTPVLNFKVVGPTKDQPPQFYLYPA